LVGFKPVSVSRIAGWDHWRGFVDDVVMKYLDCGVFEAGLPGCSAASAMRSSSSRAGARVAGVVARWLDETLERD